MPGKIKFILGHRCKENGFYSEKIEDTFNKLKEYLGGRIDSKVWGYDHHTKLNSITFDGDYSGLISHMDNSNFMGMPSLIMGEIRGEMNKKEYESLCKLVEELGYKVENNAQESLLMAKRNI